MGLPDFRHMCERAGLVRTGGGRGGGGGAQGALASRDVTHRDVRFAFVWSLQTNADDMPVLRITNNLYTSQIFLLAQR